MRVAGRCHALFDLILAPFRAASTVNSVSAGWESMYLTLAPTWRSLGARTGPRFAALNVVGEIFSEPITGGGTGGAGAGGGGAGADGAKSTHPGSALHTSRRPPLITLPWSG